MEGADQSSLPAWALEESSEVAAPPAWPWAQAEAEGDAQAKEGGGHPWMEVGGGQGLGEGPPGPCKADGVGERLGSAGGAAEGRVGVQGEEERVEGAAGGGGGVGISFSGTGGGGGGTWLRFRVFPLMDLRSIPHHRSCRPCLLTMKRMF